MADGSSIPRDRIACAACGGSGEDMQAAHARMLRRMAEIVLDIAEAVRDEVMDARAEAPASEAPRPVRTDVGLTLSRLARALRLTLALERRFADEAAAFAEQNRARTAADAEAALKAAAFHQKTLAWTRQDKRDAIEIAKTMAVEHLREQGVREFDRESLFSELDERLFDDSDLEALSDYSLVELVSLLCAKLGAPFDPAQWDEDDEALRREWLDPEPDPPPKPPDHPAWAADPAPGPS